MTLKHVKIFISVCDTGSMTAASKELFIAQPAVSFAIAELENYYGQKLFDRISNRLYITQAGKVLLEYARQIVSMFDDMESELRNWDNLETLRIGSGVSIGGYLLPRLMPDFQAAHPRVNVQVSIHNAPTIEHLVLDSKLDVAIIEGPISNKFIASQKITQSDLVFICAPNHPWAGLEINPEQLSGCSFIMREKGSMERKLLDKMLLDHKIKVNLAWQSVSPDSIVRAVSSGLGIAGVSRFSAEGYLTQGTIAQFQVKDIALTREGFLVYHQNKVLTPIIQDFLDLCRDSCL